MADSADIASDYAERERTHRIAVARGEIPNGTPGECEQCGEWFDRLVGGLCVACRNRAEIMANPRRA